MPKKNETPKLVVTNYDNFKNADFFIKQYYKAQEMLKEVDNFFASFTMSKLLTASQLTTIHPLMYIAHYGSPWTATFINNSSFIDKCRDWEVLEGKKWSTNKKFTTEEKAERIKETKKNTQLLCENIANTIHGDYDCYYVLDEHNYLHEFIPVKAAHTIKTDFTKKSIIISGYYYHYSEWGAQWGKSGSCMEKVVKKIIIDPATNNVKDVEEDEITISEGNANGKSYWDHHDNYCLSALDGKHKVNTNNWDNVKKAMHLYNHELWEHGRFLKNNEERLARKKMLIEKYSERYKKAYNKELTDDILEYYFPSIKLE